MKTTKPASAIYLRLSQHDLSSLEHLADTAEQSPQNYLRSLIRKEADPGKRLPLNHKEKARLADKMAIVFTHYLLSINDMDEDQKRELVKRSDPLAFLLERTL